jgi:predicted CXXCH cytochrome family protein
MLKGRLIALLLLSPLVLTTTTFAAQPDKIGPEIIKLKMGKKSLEFTHHKHQKLVKGQCWECHDKKLGKIDNWSEATAHRLCIACHDLNEKGPVICKGCHKK